MNSISNHTPGPWKSYGENICAKLASDTRTEIVATTCGFQSTQSNIANAQLIAAAPELLAALENAANVLAGLATGDLKTIQRDSPALLQARKAIAKAKGQ